MMENDRAALLKQGCEATVTITIYYEAWNTSTLRPDHFDIVTKAYDPILDDDIAGIQRSNNVYGEQFNWFHMIVFYEP